MNTLKTGDLLLFNSHKKGWWNILSSLIRWGTHSNYTHIGMIVKNPEFLDNKLEGMYLWESSWEGTPDPQDGKVKLGVQFTPISEIFLKYQPGEIFVRRIKCPENTFSISKLREIHKIVYNKPYDIIPRDWIETFFGKDSEPQKTDRFWCSSLIGYIYTKCEILLPDTDWSILTPSDFSIEGEESLNFVNGNSFENFEEVL